MRPIPAELCAGPFRRADAIRLGVTERMLQGRRFRRLLRDVYVLSDLPVTHALTCAAVPLAVPKESSATRRPSLRAASPSAWASRLLSART